MTYLFLGAVKKLLQQEVCSKIKLKRPDPEHAETFELVSPTISIGWPNAPIGSRETRYRIPGIAIGIAEPMTDDGSERKLSIQLAAIVYSTGSIGSDGKLTVDNDGYHDLLNLMDLTVGAVIDAGVIDGLLMLADPPIVRWQPDNEPCGDYWMGHIEFTLTAASIPRREEQDLL